MTDLKPCPFCGGEALLHKSSQFGALWKVSCKNCDAGPHGQLREIDAERLWNNRAALSPPASDECSCPNIGHCDGSCMNRRQAENEISDLNRNFAGHCQQLIDLIDNYDIGNIAVDEDLDMIEDIRASLSALPTPSATE